MRKLREHAAREMVVPRPKGNAQHIAKVRGRLRIVNDASVIRRQRAIVRALSFCAPAPPLSGAVLVDVVFYLPMPARWPKWKRAAALRGLVMPYSETDGSGSIPDRGNLLKLAEDGLEKAGWVTNDSQVCSGLVDKRYGAEACYEFRAMELFEVRSCEEWKALLQSEELGA